MGRPRRKDADYFSHDANMRNNRKIKALRVKYGFEGYAIYTMLLETLTGSDNFTFVLDDEELELIAGDFGLSSERLSELVDYLTSLKLLQRDENLIYSDDLIKLLEPLLDKRRRDLEYRHRKTGSTKDFYDENSQSKEEQSKPKIRREEIDDLIARDDLIMEIVMSSSEVSYVNKLRLLEVIGNLRDAGVNDDEIYVFIHEKTPKTLTTKNIFLADWLCEVKNAKAN